jgi:hypothetical protein
MTGWVNLNMDQQFSLPLHSKDTTGQGAVITQAGTISLHRTAEATKKIFILSDFTFAMYQLIPF